MGFGIGWNSSAPSSAGVLAALVGQDINAASATLSGGVTAQYLSTTGAVPGLAGVANVYVGSYDVARSGIWLLQHGVAPSVTNYAMVADGSTITFGGANADYKVVASNAASGQNAFLVSTAGARLKLSSGGTTDYFISDGATTITAAGSLSALGVINGALLRANTGGALTTGNVQAGDAEIQGAVANGSTAIAVAIGNSNALSTAGAKIVAFYSDSFSSQKAFIDKDGGFTSNTAGGNTALGMNDLAKLAWSATTIQGNGTQLFLNSNGATMLTVDRATPTVSTVAGSGLSTVNIIGQLNLNTSAAGNAADTTEDNLMSFSIPANTMTVTNRGFRVTAWGSGVSTTDVTTVRMYFGDPATLKSGTLVISKVLTASQTNTWRIVAEILRTGASAQVATAVIYNGGTAASFAQSNATPAGATAGAMLVGCTGQRATTSAANSVQQLGMIVEYI